MSTTSSADIGVSGAGHWSGLAPPRLPFRRALETLRVVKLQHVLFAALMLVAAVPVLLLAAWVQHTAVEKEMAAVQEKHLLLARNLGNTLARYADDARAVFDLAVDNERRGIDVAGLPKLLRSLDFRHVCIVGQDGAVLKIINAPGMPRVSVAEVLPQLRQLASAAGGETVFSDLIQFGGRPELFIVRDLGGGQLGIGELATDYIVEQQKKIAFGAKGHSAIIDRTGHVIAHPNKEWRDVGFDLSRVPISQEMMAGRTGVATFYSPAVHADMVAGYTAVPGVGWGVMVPQPVSELMEHAGNVQSMAFAITLFGFLVAGLISWWLAKFLARPIEGIALVAEEIARGDYGARVADTSRVVTKEVCKLGHSFNHMVDELSRKNEELVDTAVRAEAANRAKSEFLANMSHEFRTPLNAIIGFSECMRDEVFGPVGNPRYANYIKDVHTSGKHLLEVISGILDLSKAEAGTIDVSLRPVDPGNVSQVALRMVEQRAQQGGVTLRRRIDPELEHTSILSDESKLLQVLLNLLSNAVKFTPYGGTVTLDVAAPKPGSIVFVVRDTGIGIRPEDMARVMEPFGQAVSAFHAHEGTGLGLPLAKKLAESLGGSLRIDSVAGSGTTVAVELPREVRGEAVAA